MLSLLAMSLLVLQSPTAQTPVEMTTYQMVLLMKGAAAPPGAPDAQRKMQQEHLARLADLNRKRVNLLYGPILTPESPIAGVAVLDVKTAEDAARAFADDPFVKAGVMTVTVHPWFGPKNWFQQPVSYDTSSPASLEPLIFGILMRGGTRSQDAKAGEEIQKGHLAYLESLHAQGKLPVAGPFGDEGDMRGIVVYRVKDVDEAKALAAQDPAVKAGGLQLVAYQWMTFKGILP
jgi:uncharacterized protein YciI